MKPRFFDYVAVAVALAIVAGFSLFAYAGRGRRGEVRVEASGTQYVYPLSVERRVPVQGPLGATVVVIRGGKATVEDSPCPDKLCVRMAAISKPGQWIACLPNKVFLRVSGTTGEQVDDSSY